MTRTAGALLLCLFGSVGCYHATITTGAAPSPQTIEKPFASSWIYGLVPPSAVETSAKCKDGVARIETQLSFANQLVSFITFGIYTPMDIRVTCAATPSPDGPQPSGMPTYSTQSFGGPSVGLLAGVDFANMGGTDFAVTTSTSAGFIGGLYVSIPVGAGVRVEPEVLYAMKGFDVDSTFSLDHSYIEVPLLIRYSFKPTGGPYVLAGPTLGFSVSCNVVESGFGEYSCLDAGLEPQTTFGGVVGIGIKAGPIGVEGRYDFDFSEAFKDFNVKNHMWVVMARIGVGG